MIEKITATIRLYFAGPTDIEAWTTATPGLITHPSIDGNGEWTITHQPSGAAMAYAPDPEAAQAIAHQLGIYADWTQPLEVVHECLGETDPNDTCCEHVIESYGGYREGSRL